MLMFVQNKRLEDYKKVVVVVGAVGVVVVVVLVVVVVVLKVAKQAISEKKKSAKTPLQLR